MNQLIHSSKDKSHYKAAEISEIKWQDFEYTHAKNYHQHKLLTPGNATKTPSEMKGHDSARHKHSSTI